MNTPMRHKGLVNAQRLLVVDDDVGLADCIQCLLRTNGYGSEVRHQVADGLKLLREEEFDLVITDLRLPDSTGLDLIRTVKDEAIDVPVILMTSFSSMESAIQALRLGAVDYMMKPFDNEDLLHAIQRALTERQLRRENRVLKRNLKKVYGTREIVGKSPGMREVFKLIERVAVSDAQVLIQGESGTGKELVARAVHQASHRADGPFVAVNCGAIPADLMESELFGHVRGAYTGATENSEGLIREAIGGTLLFDEISEMPFNLQVKLLRVLQEREVRPVGSSRSYPVDVRFLAATNKDLQALIASGDFREDLYFRLNVITLTVPPLCARGEDIELLAERFIEHYSRAMGKQIHGISDSLRTFLTTYEWPGNVRELQNLIERAVILADGDVLDMHHIGKVGGMAPEGGHRSREVRSYTEADLLDQMLSVEEYICAFLQRHQDRYSETELAQMLGMGRKALWARRRKWGLRRGERAMGGSVGAHKLSDRERH